MDPARAAAGSVDRRALASVGRTARLDLTFERRGLRTVLTRSYAEPPFRVGPTTDIDGAAYFILVCAGPGVFGGDDLQQFVHVGRGARVMLTSQSALQVHPSPSASSARVRQDYRVDEDGELVAEWDPVIPFADARFDQRIALDVAAGARLFWSDAFVAGRTGRGERWQFHALGHELRVRLAGALAYLERYRLTPRYAPARPWIAGGAHQFGTTIVAHPGATADAAAELHSRLALQAVTAGVDSPQDGLLLARLASSSGAQFAAAREATRRTVLESIFGRAAAAKRK